MKKQFNVTDLKKVVKKHSMDNNSVHALFYIYLVVYVDLLKLASKSKIQILVRSARQNFIINLVTTLEVFCKGLIMEYKGWWNPVGLSELLQEKITLNQAFELLTESKRQKFSKELVVVDSYSFSNFDSITFVFCKLTGKKNFNDIIGENIKINSWQLVFKRLFDSRNNIVHEGEDLNFKDKEIKEFENLVTQYVESVVNYIHTNYKTEFK